MTPPRRHPVEHHPVVILLSVWVAMLFWIAVFWVGAAAALAFDQRLGTLTFSPAWLWWMGIGLVLVGAWLVFWASFILITKGGGSPAGFFSAPVRLVTWGMYGRLRHPMYLGFIAFSFGFGILLDSLSFTLLFTPVLIVVLGTRAFLEEHALMQKHGDQYRHYQSLAPAFRPRVRRST